MDADRRRIVERDDPHLESFKVIQGCSMMQSHYSQDGLRESATFGRDVIYEIQRAARTGIYDIRGWGGQAPGAPF